MINRRRDVFGRPLVDEGRGQQSVACGAKVHVDLQHLPYRDQWYMQLQQRSIVSDKELIELACRTTRTNSYFQISGSDTPA